MIQTGDTALLKAIAMTDADGRKGKHGHGGRNDQQWPPETQWSHGGNANSPACPAPQTVKVGKAG